MACGAPSKGVSRAPTSGQLTSPTRTEHRPAMTTTQTSESSASTTTRPPLGIQVALKRTKRQPAVCGVTVTRPSRPRTKSEFTSQIPPLLWFCLLVGLPGVAHARRLRDLGDRHVPPRLVAGHGRIAIDLDVDHYGAIDLLRLRNSFAKQGVRAVANERVDLAVRGRHLHAESARDLVTHAGIAVLDVVLLAVARAPELVQIPGH